jgi:uncharacterized membrane protein YfcA
MPVITILLAVLGAMTLLFLSQFARSWAKSPAVPGFEGILLSAIANFFDALGIGSFAPSTAYLKLRRLVPDDLIPPTMIAGYTIATVTEAFVYITSVAVDPALLFFCIAASSAGAFAGVTLGPRLPVNAIRLTIGFGLSIAALLYAASNLGLMPVGGEATSLPVGQLLVVAFISFLLGILTNLGIGSFAPTLILLSLLGMDPRAAFPIMMGSAAFIFVTSGTKILRDRALDMRLVAGMALGGAPAVLLAAYVIKSLPLETLRWGVVVIVGYAAIVMLKSAVQSKGASAGRRAVAPGAS